MFERTYKKFLFLFQIYGTLPELRKFSLWVTLFWLFIGSGLYIWWALELRMMTTFWIVTMSDIIYFMFYCAHLLTELAVLIISLTKAATVGELYRKFSTFDKELWEVFNAGIDYKKGKRKVGVKIIFILFFTITLTCVHLSLYELVIAMEILHGAFLTHMIHIKIISFIFFVELLNERFRMVYEIIKSNSRKPKADLTNVVIIHAELFHLSRLIHQVFGVVMSLITSFCCMRITVGSYFVFLRASGIDSRYTLYGTYHLLPILLLKII